MLVLKPGATTETVTVTTEAPLMQTQEKRSVGQTIDTETINSIPLNGRNAMYMAQLSAGTAVADGSRGALKGDFEANGQRAEENDFILDGVDNNVNVVDFYNGASFTVSPPPDALAEFKVQTSNYSAEYGHSAGAVVNVSIKPGTNTFHGSTWEYARNTAFDIHTWNDGGAPVPSYHDNQFGVTLGGPFIKNKLFFFGDAQATRNLPRGRELLHRSHLADAQRQLRANCSIQPLHRMGTHTRSTYQDPTGAAPPTLIPNNDLSSFRGGSLINATALKFLSYFPAPTAGITNIYNNYLAVRPVVDNTFQWDARMDYNIGNRDNAYSRYSYANEMGHNAPPLGNIVDGGGFGDDGKQKDYAANFMFSETHTFSPTFTNEARFGFNYLHTGFQHPNAGDLNSASSIGFGGIPVAPLNGAACSGLNISGLSGAVAVLRGRPPTSTTTSTRSLTMSPRLRETTR